MFEQFIREIKDLEMNRPGGVAVPIDMPLDENGYFDRTCPNRECGATFKVFVDWRDKVPDSAAYCPKCGKDYEPSEFNTGWQKRYVQDSAEAYAQEQINRALGRAARRSRPQKLSCGQFEITMSVSHRPGPRRLVLPPTADKLLRQDIECEPCGCRYSTIGTGYFCPACGHNSVLRDFDQTIATARKSVEAIEEIKQAVASKHNEDVAANIVDQIIEDQVENLVTAMQRVTESLFDELPNASSFAHDANLFQRLDDASGLWVSASRTGYEDILSTSEMAELAKMIQRRHKLGHWQGMVDQRYVDKSGDGSYSIGQRLVFRPHHVTRLADILAKLVAGLRSVIAQHAP